MGRKTNLSHVARNLEIARRYSQDGTKLESLEASFGLSRSRLRRILRAQGITPSHSNSGSRAEQHCPTVHGLAIADRLMADNRKRNLSLAEYGLLLGLSEPKMAEAMRGSYNWRLTEMVRASEALSVPLIALIADELAVQVQA